MKKESRRHMLQRYEKERCRNLLAEPGTHDFVVVLDHLKAGYNVGKIFRSAEAFGAREVHLVGIGPFDPAPAKGAFRKVPARFHENFEECHADLAGRGYRFFVLEPGVTDSLTSISFPQKSAFVFGHEEFGMSFDPQAFPDVSTLSIPQFGSVQSLNVSVAAAVVMYEYVRQFQKGIG